MSVNIKHSRKKKIFSSFCLELPPLQLLSLKFFVLVKEMLFYFSRGRREWVLHLVAIMRRLAHQVELLPESGNPDLLIASGETHLKCTISAGH